MPKVEGGKKEYKTEFWRKGRENSRKLPTEKLKEKKVVGGFEQTVLPIFVQAARESKVGVENMLNSGPTKQRTMTSLPEKKKKGLTKGPIKCQREQWVANGRRQPSGGGRRQKGGGEKKELRPATIRSFRKNVSFLSRGKGGGGNANPKKKHGQPRRGKFHWVELTKNKGN